MTEHNNPPAFPTKQPMSSDFLGLTMLDHFAELWRNEVLEEAAKVCRKEAERALFNWKNDLPVNQSFWNGAEQMAAGCANDIASRKALP